MAAISIIDPFIEQHIETSNISKLENECSTAIERVNLDCLTEDLYKKESTFQSDILTSTVLYHINKKFHQDIKRYPSFNNNLEIKAKEYFSIMLKKFCVISSTNIICSLTDSESIYFRFYKDTFIGHIEVFYDYDGSKDDIEAIVSIYNNDKIQIKRYGDLEYIFNSIIDEIEPRNKEAQITECLANDISKQNSSK